MSTGCRHCFYVLWITFQFMMAVTYLGAGSAMAIARFEPYVSEFEFASRFHPSKNPDCLSGWSTDSTDGNDEFPRSNFASWRSRRSPEEGSPVGQEPNIEVRAILVRCPRTEEETDDVLTNRNVYNITAGRSQDILDFHGFDRDEPAHHSEVRNCRRKLIITMKFNNIGRTKIQEEFVVIDHVLDPVTMHKARLLNPLVVKVRQEPVLQLYGLKFQGGCRYRPSVSYLQSVHNFLLSERQGFVYKRLPSMELKLFYRLLYQLPTADKPDLVVNAEAREEVINKKLSNYTGCDDVSENPTCGQMIFEGKPIPYSQGFCCSCDPELNLQREAALFNQSMIPPFPSFFSKSRDRPIRPFKSPRSVNENFLEGLSELDEPSQNKASRNVEALVEPNNDNSNFHFDLPGDVSSLTRTHDDEADLIKLKHSKRTRKDNQNPAIWMTDFDAVVDKNGFDSKGKIDRQNVLIRQSIDSRTSNKELKTSTDPKRFGESGKETISNQMDQIDQTETRHELSDRLNLTAELMRLEQDYKTFRMSSLRRAESQNNKLNHRPLGRKHFSQAVVNKTADKDFLTGRIQEKVETRMGYDRQEESSISTYVGKLPEPTLNIDVLFAIRPKQELPARPLNSSTDLMTTSSPERTIGQSLPETVTAAVSRQKLVSDIVYPSSSEINADKIDDHQEISGFNSMNRSSDSDQIIGTYHSDVLGNVGTSHDAELSNNTQGNMDQSTLRRMNDPSSEDSMTSSPDIDMESTSEGSTENLKRTQGASQSFDSLSSQPKSPGNSSSSFSGGSHSKGDAILLSGSLKNQLANWFLRDKGRKKFGWKGGGRKSRKDFGQDGEIGFFEMVIPAMTADTLTNGHRYEPRLMTNFKRRRPVEIHLEPHRSFQLSYANDEAKSIPKTRDSHDKGSRYSDPEGADALSSARLNVPRSYRSIADESVSNKDSERQRSIDKKIEDEFVDISEALKDAADGPKIIRRPNSESNFEKDDSVIAKFDRIVNELPGSKSMMESSFRVLDDRDEEPSSLETEIGSEITKHHEGYGGTNLPLAAGHHETQVRKYSPLFGDRASGITAEPAIHSSGIHEQIVKQTETSGEPVSEIALTTGHQIVVDRFKLVQNIQDLPERHEGTLTSIQPTKKRDNGYKTESISEVVQALGPDMTFDRLRPMIHLQEVVTDKLLQGRSSTSKIRHVKEEFSTNVALEPIAIVVSDDNPPVGNDSSLHRPLSPVLTIENLKKELRKEASHLRDAASNARGVQGHSNIVDEVREVNSELTPAEKVEDLVTYEETLLPDEETKFTTKVPNTTRKTRNEVLLPRLAFRDSETSLENETVAKPLKRTNKVLIVLEESSPTSSSSFLHLGSKRTHKKRHHRRHHHPRISRNKRRSIENDTDDGPMMKNPVINGRMDSKDDKDPWYDETNKKTDQVKKSVSVETKSLGDVVGFTSKVLKRRKMPWVARKTIQNHELAQESSTTSPKPVSSSGKLFVSMFRIPEVDDHAILAGLRVEEIPKVKSQEGTESLTDFNVDESRTSMMNPSTQAPEAPGEVDEMPLFQRTEPPRIQDDPKGGKSPAISEKGFRLVRKISTATEVPKMDFQTPSKPKFRSFYPKSSEVALMSGTEVDLVTGSVTDSIARNDKRDDITNSDDGDAEATIFYDYEAVDSTTPASITEGRDEENKRSLVEGFDPKNKYFDELRSRVKSAEVALTRSEHQLAARDSNPGSHNLYVNGRLGEEALSGPKGRRSKNISANQLRIEPSTGWKEKMELLKLRKHADVLKEYLNWHHDIVPPEPHAISGYTTKISMSNEREDGTSEVLTTHDFRLSNGTALPSSFVKFPAVTDDVSKVIHDQNAFTTLMTSSNDYYLSKQTEATTSSSSFSLTTYHLGNCSFNYGNGTDNVESLTGNPKYESEEAATGKILPPCCPTTKDEFTTCPTGLHRKADRLSSSFYLSKPPEPKVAYDHRGQLNDVEKDLVIISVMENNRFRNQNLDESNRGGTSSSKIYWTPEDGHPDSMPHNRRHKLKNKINYPSSLMSGESGPHRLTGRQLMSVDDTDYNANEEDDLIFDDPEGFVNVDRDTDAIDDDEDSKSLKNKWNLLIDKVFHTNSSEVWKFNSSNSSLPKDSGDSRSAMKQMHFVNADKYIKQVAKKIAHFSNIHDKKHEAGVSGGKNRARHVVLGRKLKSLARGKSVRMDKGSVEAYEGSTNNKRAASRLRFKIDDTYDDPHELPAPRFSSEPRNADSNVTSRQESSDQDQSGRDFAISLSGRIHVEGGTNGQPMSISFDTSPEISNKNQSVQVESNESPDVDNSTDIETSPSPNFLSSLFNIASVPKDVAHHSQETNDHLNSSVSEHRSANLRSSREDYRRKLPHVAKKPAYVRRSRAVDLEEADEESDFEDYSESLFADDESEHEEADDSQFPLQEQRNLNSGHASDVDGDLVHHDHNPDVKVIKIIPLDVPKSFSSALSSKRNDWQDENKGDRKAGRMVASQLPKMEDELASEVTVKPGIIRPVDLPWRENEDDDDRSHMQSVETLHQDSLSCSSTSESAFGSPPVDRRISTSDPSSLKVIGLVSMEQPSINGTKKQNGNLDANYEIVPMIHVKIQQQPNDRESSDRDYDHPDNPDSNVLSGGCPKIEMSKMPQHSHGCDSCLCSDVTNEEDGEEDNVDPDRPDVVTMIMDNDQELRQPSAVGLCRESSRTDVAKNCNSPDEESDRSGLTEKSESCSGHQEITTTPNTGCQDDSNGSTAVRKRIRMKNMLAMMEFMKRMNGLIGGDRMQNMPDTDSDNAVVHLARVVVSPVNESREISGRPVDLDGATDRLVMIGEGVNHDHPHIDVTSEARTNTSTLKAATKDQDQSFLFYGNNDKVGAVNQVASRGPKYRDFPSTDKGQENVTEGPNGGFGERESSDGLNETQHNETRVFARPKEPETVDPVANNWTNPYAVNSSDSAVGSEGQDIKNPRQEPESKERNVLQNLQRRINERLRGLRRDDSGRDERQDVVLSGSKRQRSIDEGDFPSMHKTKRRRLNRVNPGIRDRERQLYRRRSLPSGGGVAKLRNEKFRRLADGKRTSKGKRKKKKRRRKKKKKHRKKKKGKHHRETDIKGKTWWPFGRQLMSFSKDRDLLLDTNLDQDLVEELNLEENRNHRVPTNLKRRKSRKVHRAKFPRGNKRRTKNRRKQKKARKKKRKMKKKKGRAKRVPGRSKRQIRPGGTQARGGQDCMDRRHPPNVNPAKYLESAHCLRFSDLWYSVYELESPIMEHTVYLQLFEKHNRADGTAHWEDLTQGSMVRMGSFTRHQRDNTPTIVFTYSGAKAEPQNRALNLDPTRDRLLVPSPIPPKKASDYPEVKGGSGEYLVVKASAISKNGKECDKAGVGFAAFSKQQDRCSRTKGSCLKNQPLAYWRHDMEARNAGRPGCYFLSNFASVPSKPIKYNVSGSGSREYLGLEYHSTHVSAIDIEVRTDYNAVVRVGSSGRVTEVYVDSTALEHTVVTVVISNMGLASSPYQPRITDCPTGLPVSWTKAKGIMQVIPPQHDQRVTLDLYGQLLLNGFHCSVELVNHRGELVAMRRIRVQKMDRCFCVWHCLCACIGSVSGMGCQPMSPEHYHAAGFQGPVPVVTAETSVLMNSLKNILMISALLVLLLLVMGMLKWFIGMFTPAVGRWGLDSLLEGSRIEEYLEPELRCRCLMTDDDGWPVHPDTGQRTVRVCSRKLEFVLNVIFFLTYPIAVCCSFFKRSLNSSKQRRCCPDESKMCLINEKGNCPKMICVSTYGDNRNTKLEAEDTRYVMSELKKSQESLQNPKRTKKKGESKILTKKSSHKNKSASDVSAKRLVDDLLRSRMVYRNLTEPIGGLNIPSGAAYSLRGYFLNAEDGGYRFITPCPFKQHWLIEKNQKKASKPPESYPSNLFTRSFDGARDVYESNELSLNPKGICINVQYQEGT